MIFCVLSTQIEHQRFPFEHCLSPAYSLHAIDCAMLTPLCSILSPLLTHSDNVSAEIALGTSPGSLDIAPWEACLCDRLTEAIEAEVPFQAVLQRAKEAVQRHSKWLTQAGIARMVQAALARSVDSRATVDLYAALDLIDSIATFSALPAESMAQVIRFIAYVYYQGTRMNKHKGLAQKAWVVLQHILQSHMRNQAMVALLAVPRCASTEQNKTGFAAASGSLKMIQEKFPLGDDEGSDLPAVSVFELLPSLSDVAHGSGEVLREQVMSLLIRILMDSSARSEMMRTASWQTFMHTLELCDVTDADKVSHTLSTLLLHQSELLPPRTLRRLGHIFLTADWPLTDAMWTEMVDTADLLPDTSLHTGTRAELFASLCAKSENQDRLVELVEIEVEALRSIEEQSIWDSCVGRYVAATEAEVTSAPASIACANAVASLVYFAFKAQEDLENFAWCIHRTLKAAQKIASGACRPESRTRALHILGRIRAAIDGATYLVADETADGAMAGSTMPCSVLAADIPLDQYFYQTLDTLDTDAKLQDQQVLNCVFAILPEQLANLSLFASRPAVPKAVYTIASTRLTSAENKHAVSYVHLLNTLISYRALFSATEERQLVGILINHAGSSDTTVSKGCIHALTICCHELPETVTRQLEDIIQKMHRMVTQRHLAVHVLEFLTGLSRLPVLYSNFRFDDFKRIFGVSFSYLDSMRNAAPDRRSHPSDKASSSERDLQQGLPQYVYALAHHVIVFWYFAVRESDRPAIKEFVTNRLTYTTTDGIEVLEDQALVTIDLMDSVDAEVEIHKPFDNIMPGEVFDEKIDGKLCIRNRLFGLLLISTHTSLRTGKTLVTVRRPSGTFKTLIQSNKPNPASTPSAIRPKSHIGDEWLGEPIATSMDNDVHPIFEDDVDGRIYGNVYVPKAGSVLGSPDVLELPVIPAVGSAITIFDRTPGLDSHKAGVIYIGEGQTTEAEAFGNSSGSPDYWKFLHGLGTLRPLRGSTFNSQGLDKRDDLDGKHAFVWHNEVTELVYHVTTMMPPDPYDENATIWKKKKHTGNDYVNIIFNNSGLPFRFDMFPSQFDYVYIVITPSVRTTFLQARTHQDSPGAGFYRIEVMTRDDFPAISSAYEPKMVSAASLPVYVRNLALNACIFAEVWANKDLSDYRSSWRERLRQIRQLRERYTPKLGIPTADPKDKGKGKEREDGKGRTILASWLKK